MSASASYTSPASNIQQCVEWCRGTDSDYAALSDQECWCSNDLNNYDMSTLQSSCNIPCPGDEEQICGGTDVTSVYFISKSSYYLKIWICHKELLLAFLGKVTGIHEAQSLRQSKQSPCETQISVFKLLSKTLSRKFFNANHDSQKKGILSCFIMSANNYMVYKLHALHYVYTSCSKIQCNNPNHRMFKVQHLSNIFCLLYAEMYTVLPLLIYLQNEIMRFDMYLIACNTCKILPSHHYKVCLYVQVYPIYMPSK